MRTLLSALVICISLTGTALAGAARYTPTLTDYDFQADSGNGRITNCSYSYRAIYRDGIGKTRAAMGTISVLFNGKAPEYTHKSIAAIYSDDKSEIKRNKVIYSSIALPDAEITKSSVAGRMVEDYYMATYSIAKGQKTNPIINSMDGWVLSLRLAGQPDEMQIDMPSFQQVGKIGVGNALAKCYRTGLAQMG